MSDRDRKREEKERLWNEVMNKNRSFETNSSTAEEITLEAGDQKSTTKSTMKSADSALLELNEILKKQQKELQQLSQNVQNEYDRSSIDIDQLSNELSKDYGVVETAEKKENFDSKKVFDQVTNDINEAIAGESEAVRELSIAFRRPFVMGYDETKARNVILVSGPKGTGRHDAIIACAKSLKRQNVFQSDEVYTIDMSRYTSGTQEQIFLQDLYQSLNGSGLVVCFEKFESSFPSFLRMIDALVTSGSLTLNKRYVLTKGILVENQTGLVKNSVDSLSASGKYLVFITENKPAKVQDYFGADFMYHVLDIVTFQPLDETGISLVIEKESSSFIKKCNENLKISVNINPDIKKWVSLHFDKTQGSESISAMFYDMYVCLSELVLDQNLGANEKVELKTVDDQPYAIDQDHKVLLTRTKNSTQELAEINAEMDEIVGLEKVKEYVRSIEAHVKVQTQRRQQGMKTAEVSKHMIFTGNPGTGKTTIARLLSRYMKAIGALSEGQLVEVTRADLVAQYVGQTAPLTMSVIKSAIGGVLFIDEAYSLYRGKDDAFGLEAIDTLVKAMEDNRDNLIVILAGYKKEMAAFLEANSGLKSRFPNVIEFPDYTGEELLKIAILQAKSKGYVIEEAAQVKLEKFFDHVQKTNAAEAGNGRFARNVIEDAILKQSKRLIQEPDADLSLLKDADFTYQQA